MKILIWTNGFWPAIGGLETQCLALAKGLIQNGHQCKIITKKTYSSWADYEKYQSICVHRYPFEQALDKSNLKEIAKISQQIRKLIEEFQPDLIHLQYTNASYLFFYDLIQRNLPIPKLITIHGLFLDDKKRLDGMYHWILKKAARVTCVSDTLLNELLNGAPLLKNTALRIYNGLAMPEMTSSPLSFDEPTILCLGRLTDEKGFDICLGAFQLLQKKIPKSKLIIAGDGCEKSFLKKLARGLGLKNNIFFMGEVPHKNVFDLLNKASLVVVPSRYEAFGLTALEAMQLARPIIASDVGGLTELIRHQETGLLVPKNDIDALATAMEYVLTQPKIATEMGQRAHEDVKERFGIPQLIKNYTAIYSQILGEHS